MNETRYAGVAQLVEQLICNQQVGGSSPSTSSTISKENMGGFPSGQRGQTVNLLSTTSVVRIHHLPPKKRVQSVLSFVLRSDFSRSSGFESRLLATCWMHVATGVPFPQKSESTTSHQETEYRKMLCFSFIFRNLVALSVA